MATTLPHVRVVASGTLGTTPDEIWSCGLKVGLTLSGSPLTLVAASQDDVDEISLNASGDWQGFITWDYGTSHDAQGLISENCALTQVKAAAVVSSGHDDPALHSTITDITTANRGAAHVAGQLYAQVPYSVALVATLLGDLYPRGAAAYGRFYIPVPNLWCHQTSAGPLDMVNGLIDNTVPTASTAPAFANRAADLINQINGMTLTSGKVVQVANISTSAALAGVRWQPITSVRVDTRPDTVRRRSNKISGRGFASALV